jgi:hypothetical protein
MLQVGLHKFIINIAGAHRGVYVQSHGFLKSHLEMLPQLATAPPTAPAALHNVLEAIA